MITWNPNEQTDQENLTWSYLRAVEWQAWPSFVLQPIVPVSFIFLPWYLVVGVVIVLCWLWAIIRHRFVSPAIAELGVLFVFLKWLTIPVAVIYLFYSGHYVPAAVSLVWTYIAGLIGYVPGAKTGIIQNKFMESFGYKGTEI
jgi:hypothetical protein